MATHTPGPWEVKEGSVGIRIPNRAGAMKWRAICSIGIPGSPEVRTMEEASACQQANARLIASAPKMLDVLRDLSARMAKAQPIIMHIAKEGLTAPGAETSLRQTLMDWQSEINAAISNATGETP